MQRLTGLESKRSQQDKSMQVIKRSIQLRQAVEKIEAIKLARAIASYSEVGG